MTDEVQWDKLLRVRTTGRDDTHSDQHHYPYEPTPYSVLERLANVDLIGKRNTLIDYGAGKGRVCFFLSYQTKCSSIICISSIFVSLFLSVMQNAGENGREIFCRRLLTWTACGNNAHKKKKHSRRIQVTVLLSI